MWDSHQWKPVVKHCWNPCICYRQVTPLCYRNDCCETSDKGLQNVRNVQARQRRKLQICVTLICTTQLNPPKWNDHSLLAEHVFLSTLVWTWNKLNFSFLLLLKVAENRSLSQVFSYLRHYEKMGEQKKWGRRAERESEKTPVGKL